jgi:hypothetical protein
MYQSNGPPSFAVSISPLSAILPAAVDDFARLWSDLPWCSRLLELGEFPIELVVSEKKLDRLNLAGRFCLRLKEILM